MLFNTNLSLLNHLLCWETNSLLAYHKTQRQLKNNNHIPMHSGCCRIFSFGALGKSTAIFLIFLHQFRKQLHISGPLSSGETTSLFHISFPHSYIVLCSFDHLMTTSCCWCSGHLQSKWHEFRAGTKIVDRRDPLQACHDLVVEIKQFSTNENHFHNRPNIREAKEFYGVVCSVVSSLSA